MWVSEWVQMWVSEWAIECKCKLVSEWVSEKVTITWKQTLTGVRFTASTATATLHIFMWVWSLLPGIWWEDFPWRRDFYLLYIHVINVCMTLFYVVNWLMHIPEDCLYPEFLCLSSFALIPSQLPWYCTSCEFIANLAWMKIGCAFWRQNGNTEDMWKKMMGFQHRLCYWSGKCQFSCIVLISKRSKQIVNSSQIWYA